jgi:hypothetical protein
MFFRFIAERLVHMAIVMWLVATLVFFIFRILPGDPAQLVLGLEPSRASLEALREQMGLNRPLFVQYTEWIWRAAQGDLGLSISQGNRPVASLIFPALWRTLELATIGVVIGLLVSVPLGILAARRAGTWVDQVTRLFALVGYSLPSYWLAILLMLAFSYHWNLFPAGGYVAPERGLRPPPAAPRPPVDHGRRRDGGRPDALHALGHARGPAPRLRPDGARQGPRPERRGLPPRAAERDDPLHHRRRDQLRRPDRRHGGHRAGVRLAGPRLAHHPVDHGALLRRRPGRGAASRRPSS